MKVIFLDFDGVITTVASEWQLDIDKMNLIKQIVDATNAKIVISSSWRRYSLMSTIKHITTGSLYIGNSGGFSLVEHVIDVTSRMYAFKYGDESKHFKIARGNEIDRWLYEHPEVDKYVIIDDDTDMLLKQQQYFVKTDSEFGICQADVDKAIQILNAV